MPTTEITRATGLVSSAAYKAMCYVATTADVTLAGEQTIDGVLTDESRVLVKDQADAAQNGIYLTSTGNWSRAPDFSRNNQVAEGTRVWVTDGNVGAQTEYVVVSPDPVDIDATDIDWQRAVDLVPTTDFATGIHNAINKGAIADADEFGIWDSVSTALRKVTWSVLRAAITFDLGSSIAGLTAKATPVDADNFVLADSAASNAGKKITWSNIKATMWAAVGGLINGSAGKTTPVDADLFLIADSAASNATKKFTWANIKATLKAYFDTLYVGVGSLPTPGQPVPTSSSYAVDTLLMCTYLSGTAVANGATTSGSNLSVFGFETSGAAVPSTSDSDVIDNVTLSGTWKNVSGRTADNNASATMWVGYWVRTA